MRGRINRKSKAPAIQPKLKVGQPGDKYEQEADAVADRVVSNAPVVEPTVQMEPTKEEEPPVQMQSEEEETVSMKADEEQVAMSPEEEEQVAMKEDEEVSMKEEEEIAAKEDEEVSMKEDEGVSMKEDEEVAAKEDEIKKKPAIQKSGDGATYASPAISQQIHQTKGQGTALNERTQQEMGQKIGGDFSGVKIHTDQNAAQLNDALGAKAFTHGNDIYFNKGKYDPGSSKGKHLLAHELTHTIQQGAVIRRGKIKKEEEKDENTTAPTTQPGGGGGSSSSNPFVAAFQDGKKGVKFTITIHADQPGSGGDRDTYELNGLDVDVGHSFIKLRKENDDSSVVEKTFGFYPSSAVDPISGPVNVAGKFIDDTGHAFEKSKSKNLSEAEFDAVLQYIDSVSSNNYDLNTYNCTDFAIEAVGAGGFVVPETHGTWPVNGGGANPGDLGQDL